MDLLDTESNGRAIWELGAALIESPMSPGKPGIPFMGPRVTVKRRYAAPLSTLHYVSGNDCGVGHDVSACW